MFLNKRLLILCRLINAMLESHLSPSTGPRGLLWLYSSPGFRMVGAGSSDQCSASVERIGGDQPCRTFCLRCILRSSERRKFDDIKLINGWRRNIGSVFSIKCLSSFKMIMTMCVYQIL